jgi:sugar diacid utilization regulator
MSWYYCFDDYALSCWLKYGVLGFSPEQICSKILLGLIAYDRKNNTEYYKTLRTFYNNKFSYTHAAGNLYIHRTTLIKRIERIVELTGLDLDDSDVNLYLELSFRYLDKSMRKRPWAYCLPYPKKSPATYGGGLLDIGCYQPA